MAAGGTTTAWRSVRNRDSSGRRPSRKLCGRPPPESIDAIRGRRRPLVALVANGAAGGRMGRWASLIKSPRTTPPTRPRSSRPAHIAPLVALIEERLEDGREAGLLIPPRDGIGSLGRDNAANRAALIVAAAVDPLVAC